MRTIFIGIVIGLIGCNSQHKKSSKLNTPIANSSLKKDTVINSKDVINKQKIALANARLDSEMNYLAYVNDHARTLKSVELRKFIKIVNNECGYYGSFSQLSNELIYYLLYVRTQDFIKSLSEVDSTKLDSCFLNQISEPLIPEPYDKIISKIKEATCDRKLKEKIIHALIEGKEYDKRYMGKHPPADSA